MTASLRSWWQKARKPLEVFGFLFVCTLMIVLLVVIVLAYIFNVNVPGLRGKTLWDWLQLLIIPAVLAIGGYVFNHTMSRNEQRTTTDNQREAALQSWIDTMSELFLKVHLGELKLEDEGVREIARVHTLTVLRRLDGTRKGSVIQFMYESGLLDKDKRIIDLRNADLSGVDLSGLDLSEINLSDTDLSGANLKGVTGITVEELKKQAKSLEGAIMPNGSKHP
jgi:pentapeptide repeat protein